MSDLDVRRLREDLDAIELAAGLTLVPRPPIGEAPHRVIGQIRMLAYVNVYRRQVSSAGLN